MRFNFAARLATARGQPGDGGEIKPADLLGTSSIADPSGVVDRVLAMTSGLELSAEGRQALVDYLNASGPLALDNSAALDLKARGLVHLALATPTFQLA